MTLGDHCAELTTLCRIDRLPLNVVLYISRKHYFSLNLKNHTSLIPFSVMIMVMKEFHLVLVVK